MPIMDGLETTRRIRRQEQEDEHLPIIAMSASVLKEEQQACFDTGMNDFVLKPIDFERLFKILEEIVLIPAEYQMANWAS